MIRYTLVYTFLAIIMVALVFVIGMPWKSERRKDPWDNHPSDCPPRT